jgi:hypothetical protein
MRSLDGSGAVRLAARARVFLAVALDALVLRFDRVDADASPSSIPASSTVVVVSSLIANRSCRDPPFR